MWEMDATSCLTRREGNVTVFVVVDHCAAECIGIHAARPGTRFEAVEPLRQGVQASFGAYTEGSATGLRARHDHGSQYVSDYFQAELTLLGIESTPAFVREPEGNGAERFIRTLKEQLPWVRTFDTVEDLRVALLEVKERYNREWLCEDTGIRHPRSERESRAACWPRESSHQHGVHEITRGTDYPCGSGSGRRVRANAGRFNPR
jgi:hypothetical protein